ncbi:unnamed protein product [Sphagnum jensenii]|uniref:Uncharacterized protein n=1 Tax=Sphagnum jensenii TaxID=128206 RepID=A0ABP0WFF0_9BRYO
MAARMAKSWSSTTKQVFKICRNSGVPDTAATTAAQRAVVASNSSRLTSSVSSPSRSFKSLFETRRPASVFFRLPGELACVQSLLPLHSAVASARMVPQLNATADTLLQAQARFLKPR